MRNIGSIDKLMRITLGILLLSLVFVGSKSIYGLIGLVPLATGLINFCPLYRLLNINSHRVK